MKILLLALLLFVHCDGKVFRISSSTNKDSSCNFPGYDGGAPKEISIETIEAPTAKLEANFLGRYFNLVGQSANEVMHMTNQMKNFIKVVESTKTALATLGKLSSCLGMFGAAFGIVTEFTKPTPADILKATNKAIDKLTNEVNNKFKDMKDYVDESILDIKKDTLKSKYTFYETYFGDCVVYAENDPKQELSCMKEAMHGIKASRGDFTPFFDEGQLWSKGAKPAIKKVKEIETSLLMHRMYCTLWLKVNGVLVQEFQNKTSKADKGYYKLYVGWLKDGAQGCIDYTQFAYNWIEDMHVKRDNCEASFECGKVINIREGIGEPFNVNTADKVVCTCLIDASNQQTKTCATTAVVRVDRKTIYKQYRYSTESTTTAAKIHAKKNLLKKEKPYLKASKKAVKEYWNKQVMEQMDLWKKLVEKAEQWLTEIEEGTEEPTMEEMKKEMSSQKTKMRFEKAQKTVSQFTAFKEDFSDQVTNVHTISQE